MIPKPLLDVRRRLIAARQRREYGSLPAEEAFERIYLEGTWGQKFDSGAGSADAITGSYVRLIRSFIDEHEIRSVVDLGCGDFRVGRQLVSGDVDYIGVDLVRPLVERNQRLYGSPKVRFEHANMIEDELPRGELHEQRFSSGALTAEAAVLKIEALAARGDHVGAAAQARAFLSAYPNTPHAAHVRDILHEQEPRALADPRETPKR